MSLDVIIQHDAARAALVDAMGLNLALGKDLVRYLGLFRPASRNLTMDRVASLLAELAPLIHAARIQHKGSTYAAPLEHWRSAIDELMGKRDTLTLPLKTHGYLLAMLAGYAGQVGARAEQAQQQRRSGVTPVGVSAAHRPVDTTPAPPRASAADSAHHRQAIKNLIASKLVNEAKGD